MDYQLTTAEVRYYFSIGFEPRDWETQVELRAAFDRWLEGVKDTGELCGN